MASHGAFTLLMTSLVTLLCAPDAVGMATDADKLPAVFDNDPSHWDWSRGAPPSVYIRSTTTITQQQPVDDFTPVENINKSSIFSERAGKHSNTCFHDCILNS